MPMHNPPHPGLTVRHDCLEPLGLTVTEGAKVLGVTRQALNNLVNGKAGISPEMAVRLSKAFGTTPETWLRLQMAYDLAQVRQKNHVFQSQESLRHPRLVFVHVQARTRCTRPGAIRASPCSSPSTRPIRPTRATSAAAPATRTGAPSSTPSGSSRERRPRRERSWLAGRRQPF